MKIRSITFFCGPLQKDVFHKLATLGTRTREKFIQAGFEVQTIRLATIPFPYLLKDSREQAAVQLAKQLEIEARNCGFDYLSLGCALMDSPQSYSCVPAMLAETQNVFLGGVMATTRQGVGLPAVRSCGEIIHRTARITSDGFTNLRFAALACVPPFAPFFPAAYGEGEGISFALAIQSADEAVKAFSEANSLAEARKLLLNRLNTLGRSLKLTAEDAVKGIGVEFKGVDFSLAPFPADWCSLGGAMERLGVAKLGQSGSLAAAAFLADTLDRGTWKRVGFNGLMLPVLEDSILAQRATEGTLEVRDLLLYSAVCGTGLDTIPLPGDASQAQLEGLLLDMAALSTRLGKPLTARLLPVPGKKAGEMTEFKFDYFANGRVMALPACGVSGFLNGNEDIPLNPRRG